jgi:hypothetical protein
VLLSQQNLTDGLACSHIHAWLACSHIHAWHLLEPGRDQKYNPRKLYGRWDWDLATRFSAQKEKKTAYSSGAAAGCDRPWKLR